MFTLPELPYAYTALEPYIDEMTMKIHHDKHHAAYVKNLNDALAGKTDWLQKPIQEVLKNLSQIPQDIRTKVRNNGGGHANHTMFWEVMRPLDSARGKPGGALLKALEKTYGSFEAFQEQFEAKATGRFGSGWAWLCVHNEGLCLCSTANQDNPIMKDIECDCGAQCTCDNTCRPILGLDVWEHAYYLKYQNMRADYIKNWWNVVNWDEVTKRYEAA